ncbi:MAG: hypothetical protein ABIT83_09675 [Massilia sp.]
MTKFSTLILTVLLAAGLHSAALAGTGTQPAPSFKGGFSSQRSSSVRPAPPPTSPSRGQFGRFGGSGPAASAPPDSSALSRDLSRQASQERALRTLDARRAPPPAPIPAPAQVRNDAPMQMPMPAQPPVVIQQRGGIGDVLAGVLIGRAMSDSHPTVYAGGPMARVDLGVEDGAARERGSFLGGVMRLFVWLLMLAVIGWAIYFAVSRIRRARRQSTPNYTFERE